VRDKCCQELFFDISIFFYAIFIALLFNGYRLKPVINVPMTGDYVHPLKELAVQPQRGWAGRPVRKGSQIHHESNTNHHGSKLELAKRVYDPLVKAVSRSACADICFWRGVSAAGGHRLRRRAFRPCVAAELTESPVFCGAKNAPKRGSEKAFYQ
jgi:hypothetical protein